MKAKVVGKLSKTLMKSAIKRYQILPIVNLTADLYAGNRTECLKSSSFSNHFVKSADQFGSTCIVRKIST